MKSLERSERIRRYYSESTGARDSAESVLFSRFLAWGRMLSLIILGLIFVFPIVVPELLMGRSSRWMVGKFANCVCWLLGVKVDVCGKDAGADGRRVLYVSNHVSYLDICVLRSCSDVRFVARGDMKSWPFFGLLSRFNETLFFARNGTEAKRQVEVLSEAIGSGGKGMNVLVFPEGTTGGGRCPLAFKTSLFQGVVESAEEGRDVYLQPISLHYRALNNMSLTQFERDFVAWVGDEGFYPHVERCLGLGCITVEVVFHDARKVEKGDDRKFLASWSEERVGSVWGETKEKLEVCKDEES